VSGAGVSVEEVREGRKNSVTSSRVERAGMSEKEAFEFR